MAFSLFNFLFPQKPSGGGVVPVPKPKPVSGSPLYSPAATQKLGGALSKVTDYPTRTILENIGKDLDSAFEFGDTRVSLKKLTVHPIKTVQGVIKDWTIGSWTANIQSQLVAETVWEPRLDGFVQRGSITNAEKAEIMKWAAIPSSVKKEKNQAFENLKNLHANGLISDDVWRGVQQSRNWDEFSDFRRGPARYAWRKVFGKKGPLYKLTPQYWLGLSKAGSWLGNTRAGQFISQQRLLAAAVGRQVVDLGKSVIKKVARTVVKTATAAAKTIGQKVLGAATWAAVSTTITSGLGTVVAGPVGTVLGAGLGYAVGKLLKVITKLAIYACGCYMLGLILLVCLVVTTIFGAFKTSDLGGASTGGETDVIELTKTAVATTTGGSQLAIGADGEIVYTITIKNIARDDLIGGQMVDDFDESNVNQPLIDAGGADTTSQPGKLVWTLPTLPTGVSETRTYRARVDTSADKVIVNTVAVTGTIQGKAVTRSSIASVIVGSPSMMYPNGWPVFGIITQGPNASPLRGGSHYGIDKEAIDIGTSVGTPVYATHDGVVYTKYMANGYGKYIDIVSPLSFSTRYAHLSAYEVVNGTAVRKGDKIGLSGNTGGSRHTTGPHLHYGFLGLEMEYDKIPVERSRIEGCVGASNCHFIQTTP